MADNSELMTIIRDAITETAKRPAGLRGPYVFDEADLQAMAAAIAARRTPVTAEAGEVSEAEVEAALQAYFGDGHPWRLSMGAAVRAEVLDGMRAALIAARRVQPKQPAPSPDAQPVVSVKEMKLSGGRSDFYVSIMVADREITPHCFRVKGMAEFEVEEYRWLFTGSPKPDMLEWLDRVADPAEDAAPPPSPDVAGLDEAIAAGSDFRDALVTRADGYNGIAPLWHGWAIMDAFLAGAAWRAALSRLTPPKQDDARDSTVGAVAWRLLSSSGTPGSIFDSEEQAAAVAEGFSGVIVQPLYTADALASARADALEKAAKVGDALYDARKSNGYDDQGRGPDEGWHEACSAITDAIRAAGGREAATALASARAEILEGVALMLDARASAAISVRMERIIRNDAAAVRALAFVNKTPVRPG